MVLKKTPGNSLGYWKIYILFSFFISACFPWLVSGQNQDIHFRHYNFLNGLSAPVRKIVQDKIGFIWLGTIDGLNRFDGKNFTVFRNIAGDSCSLPNNLINDLYVDPSNTIWIGTNGGLCYFTYQDHLFHQVEVPDTLEPTDRYRIHAITGDGGRGVWFATKTRFHHWEAVTKTLQSFSLPETKNLHISELCLSHNNQLWIGTNSSIIYLFDVLHPELISGYISSDYATRQNLTITIESFHPGLNDTMLSGTWYGGLQKIYAGNHKLQSREIINTIESDHKKHIVNGLSPWKDQQWWIGTYGTGLAIFDNTSNRFIKSLRHEEENPFSLGNDFINDLLMDRHGILWIGNENGLDQYNFRTEQFNLINIQTQNKETSINRLPSEMIEDRHDSSKLWITISGIGLFHYDRRTATFKRNPLILDGHPIDKDIYTAYYDQHGILWLGAREGLYCLDPVNNKLWPAFPIDSLTPKGVHKILTDAHGNMWFASFNSGIYCFDSTQLSWLHYCHQPGSKYILPDDRIFSMIRDGQNKIWVGTQNRGLCRIDPLTGIVTGYEHRKNDSTSLPDNNVYDLFEDPSHTLWIATENGLAALEQDRVKFKSYHIQDGLSNNIVFSITHDRANHLWLATSNGLSTFDRKKEKFKNYYIQMGLPNNRFDGASVLTSDGQLYFSTTSHVISCNPSALEVASDPPALVLTGMRIYDQPIHFYESDGQYKPIQLTYRQNMMSFEFTSINYTNPESNQYSYRLVGFDADWLNGGSRQMVTYTNLAGGQYQFKVRTLDSNGDWIEAKPLTIVITPPFWYRWWFISAWVMLFISFIYLFFRMRITQLLRLQKIRLNIARDLHDEIGSTLSSIHMVSTVAEQKKSVERNMEALKMISKASSQVMELLNEIVWSINPQNDSLEMMLIRMKQFTSAILEPANINFEFVTHGDFEKSIIPLGKRKDFYLIFKEAVNNMAKYSGATKAVIVLHYGVRNLYLKVTDDGHGFNLSEISIGNGIKNMRARANSMDATLTLETLPGKGTRIELDLPLSHNRGIFSE